MTENMSKYLEELNYFLLQKDVENVKRLLNSPDKNDVKLNNSSLVEVLLEYNDQQIVSLATEILAEWAKLEYNRNILGEKSVIDLLLNLLESEESIVLNVVRALGNICYENEVASKLLNEEGLQKILKIFYEFETENILLLTKISGLLLNIFISSEDLEFVDKNKLLSHISSLLKHSTDISSDEFCLYSYLLQIVYTLLVEYDHQLTYPEKLIMKVIDILKNSNIPELELVCLQILFVASEKDSVRLLLAKSNVCEKIFELIEKYKDLIDDEESRSILKMACDLVNNILIEDESMKLLYDQGNGKVYTTSIKWLESSDEDLLASAITAIGNFARNDENCIAIVKQGISKKLIDLIKENSSESPNIKLLHGLLSTLKNLVIPSINKKIVLEEGLIQSIQPILELDNDIVIFKLLGTLRLSIDGQEKAAIELVSQKNFLEKLVQWHRNTYHLGVKREVPRLLVWLVKNCHSWESMQNIFQTEGVVTCLISMFSSEDVIMENEALIALNLLIIASRQKNDLSIIDENLLEVDIETNLEKQLIEAEIASMLPYIRIFNHSEQIIENLLSLLEKLLQSERIIDHFREKEVSEKLKSHLTCIKAHSCLEKLQKLIKILSK